MTIEDVERFWSARPCNIRHSPVSIEDNPEWFSRSISVRKYRIEPHIWGFSQFAEWEGKYVLDLGCGIGTQTLSFARHGAQVTAVDVSEESLKVARQRARIAGLNKRIVFYRGDIERLTDFLPARTYDLVYSFGVLHHTPHPERAILAVQQYMDWGSIFKLMLYHRYSWKAAQILWRLRGQPGTVDEKVARFSEAQTGCPVTRTYTRKSARALLADFKPLSMHVDHIFPYCIPEYVRHRYVREWYWRWMPSPLFCGLERVFGWHLLITAKRKVDEAIHFCRCSVTER